MYKQSFRLAIAGEMVVTNTTFDLEKFLINVFPLKDFLNSIHPIKNGDKFFRFLLLRKILCLLLLLKVNRGNGKEKNTKSTNTNSRLDKS